MLEHIQVKNRESLHTAIILGFIIILAAGLRFYHLGFKSLWLDEAKVVLWAMESWGQAMLSNAQFNSAPPLHLILLKSTMSVLGNSEMAVRSVSWIAGVVAVPFIYMLGSHFTSRAGGLITALFFATSEVQIHYSQEVREYSLTVLFAIIILLAFVRFIRKPSMNSALLLGLTFSIGLITQYGLALLIAGGNLICLLYIYKKEYNRRKIFAWWLIPQLIALLTIILIYTFFLSHQIAAQGLGVASYLQRGFWDGSFSGFMRITFLNSIELIKFAYNSDITVMLLLIGSISILLLKKRLLPLWFLLVPAAITYFFAIAQKYPFMGARQCLFLTPSIYIFMAIGIISLANATDRKWIPAVVVAVLVSFGIVDAGEYLKDPGREHIRPLVSKLEAAITTGDNIFVYKGAVPAFEYYWEEDLHPWIADSSYGELAITTDNQIENLMNRKNKTWLVFSHISQNEVRDITKPLSEKYNLTLEYARAGAWLYYLKP